MADLNFAARWPAPLFSANNMSSFDFIKDHVNLNVRAYIYLDLGLHFQNLFWLLPPKKLLHAIIY